jgi:hypothetical protein
MSDLALHFSAGDLARVIDALLAEVRTTMDREICVACLAAALMTRGVKEALRFETRQEVAAALRDLADQIETDLAAAPQARARHH